MFPVKVCRKGIEAIYSFPWPVSIVSFMANPRLLEGENFEKSLLAMAEDPFFDIIEVPPLSREQWRVVERISRDTGVGVALGAQPAILTKGLNPSALEAEARKAAVKSLKEIIGEAVSHGVCKIALCSGSDPGPENREKAKESLAESIHELYEYARDHHATIILETFDRDWDKKQLLGPLEEALKLLEALEEEGVRIGLLWDLSHAPMLGEEPSDLEKAASYLAHVHIGCTKRLPDGSLKDLSLIHI